LRFYLISLAVFALMSQPAFSRPQQSPATSPTPAITRSDDLPAPPVRVFSPNLARLNGPPNYFLPHRELARPRVGLALSGGGSRGLFQIGVLLALEEHGVPVDFIAGTSMGSIVGGLYAAGYSAQQLREIVKDIQWEDITVDTPPRTNLFVAQRLERERAFLQVRFRGWKPYIPPAITAGQKMLDLLTDLTMRANYRAGAGFDHLRIPFRALAVDLYAGREVAIADGDLAEALRASTAVPLIFAPAAQGNMLLVDGGLLNNIPVSTVRQHVEVVIAADATSALRDRNHLNTPWEIADQLTTIMQRDEDEAQRRSADILIALDSAEYNSSDYTQIDSLVALGYRKTMAQMAAIQNLAQNLTAMRPATDAVCSARFFTFDSGREITTQAISSNGAVAIPRASATLPPLVALANLDGSNGMKLDAAAIQNWVDAIYNTGQFTAVHAELRADSLRLVVRENPRLQQVGFAGNTIYPDSTLLACMHSPAGEVINHRRSAASLLAIIERYRSDGYALAEIRRVQFDSTTGALRITIDEGRIGTIEIEGIKRTKPIVVWREFPQKNGDIFNSTISRRGIDNIHSSGLFDQVTLNIRRGMNGAVVKIKVQEKPSAVLRLGGRYDTERKTRAFIELGDENAFGVGSKIFAYQEIGNRDLVTRLSLRNDRLLKTYIGFSSSLYRQWRDNFVYPVLPSDSAREYREERLGGNATLSWQIRRFGVVSLEWRLEEVTLRGLRGLGPGNSTLNTITLRSIVDTRDQFPFPRRGRFVHAVFENVNADFGEKEPFESFLRFSLKMETFHSRGPHTIHPRLSFGAAGLNALFSEQFRLGGPDEIYGLHEQEFIRRRFAIGSLEYRYRLRRNPLPTLHLSLRYDLLDKPDTRFREFRSAFGASVAYETPLGPFSLAYGQYENSRRRVYVNFGFNF
jgi:NTE family protein